MNGGVLDGRDIRVAETRGSGAGSRGGGGGGSGFVANSAALEVTTEAGVVEAAATEATAGATEAVPRWRLRERTVMGCAEGGTFRSGGWRPTGSGLARLLALSSCYTCANAGLTRQCP